MNPKFSDKYPKNKYTQLTKEDIDDFADTIYDLIFGAYKKIGGHYEFNSPEDVKTSDLNFWIGNDIDSDPDLDTVIGGKKTKFGTKLTLIAQDGSKEAREDVKNQIKKLAETKGFYAELSEEIAEKLNLNIIKDKNIIQEVINKPIDFNEDGSYYRNLGGDEKNRHKKVLVGVIEKKFRDGGNIEETGSGKTGGMLVGRRHSEGGIKAINKATNTPIEMEGGEVVITRNAVSDNKKRMFEGQMLTNKEILSKINQSGGGVAIFEDGGELTEHKCKCSMNKYEYGGEMLTDYEIYNRMNEGSKPEMFYKEGGVVLDVDSLTNFERELLNHFNRTEVDYIITDRSNKSEISNIVKANLFYIVETPKYNSIEVFITPKGERYIQQFDLSFFRDGGELVEVEAKNIVDYYWYKGVDHKYKDRYQINMAIRELIDLYESNRIEITQNEKAFLQYYTGMGGISKVGKKYNHKEKEGDLYEFYTPSLIAKKMWALAYKYGYNGGSVLEPSCGIGEFFKYAPEDAYIKGIELDKYTFLISKILYPNVYLVNEPFEKQFIYENNTVKNKISNMEKFDLVIGNPPYGDAKSYYLGMGEREYTNSENWVEYFISRGLDLLNKGGLLIFIIGTEVANGGVPFLQQNKKKVKQDIAQKSILLDAYRLPNGVFDTTDVLSEILVFKKL
jgi:type I restriction-modification system DNA methylase subunit